MGLLKPRLFPYFAECSRWYILFAMYCIATVTFPDIPGSSHGYYHHVDRRIAIQAEAVAYTVCQRYGLETSEYSFVYIAGWSSGKETPELKASLGVIRETAHNLIAAIDAILLQLAELQGTTARPIAAVTSPNAACNRPSFPTPVTPIPTPV